VLKLLLYIINSFCKEEPILSQVLQHNVFGRDQEIEELLEKLRLQRFITVIGASGSGKFSLVFAGLVPALQQTGLFNFDEWLIYSMRPSEAPLTQLKTVVSQKSVTGKVG
jgi:excinuclease UvrABC ATPase subunit